MTNPNQRKYDTTEKNIIKILESYRETNLFYKEQREFKIKVIKELFDPIGEINYDARTILFFNAVLDDLDLPYRIYKREVSNKKTDNIFWFIISAQRDLTTNE